MDRVIAEVIKIPLRHGRLALSEMHTEVRQLGSARKLKGIDRIQLGAGEQILSGWANIDLHGYSSIPWDLTKPLPTAGPVRFIYSEHFIEHVTREQAQAILRNCHEVMAPNGVIRISTPDLAKLIEDYRSGNLASMPHGGWFPKTLCRMVNEGMHLWGHQFLYDEAELTGALAEAGFTNIRRVKWRESDTPELQNLESRPDVGDLIVEALASN